jgi:hypothetical protein
MNKYSCVYFNYEDNENNEDNDEKKIKIKKYNEKILSTNFFVENEIYISNLIKNIFFYRKYFYIPIKTQHINLINMYDEENKEENKYDYQINLEGRKKIKSDKIIFQYENISFQTLDNYLISIINQNKNIYFLQQLFSIYEKLLNSISILISENIFHNHIIEENILFNNESPIISNFSFSINMISFNIHKISNFILEYDPSYVQWPIELHLLAFMNHNKLISISIGNIEIIVNDLINNNYIFDNFNNSIKDKYFKDGINYLSKYVNKNYNVILQDICLYWHTWDNYSLSIMYLPFIIKFYKKIKNNFNKNNLFCTSFIKLLLTNISYNPINRLSIEDNLLQFNKIINNISKNEYKDLLSCF